MEAVCYFCATCLHLIIVIIIGAAPAGSTARTQSAAKKKEKMRAHCFTRPDCVSA